MKHIHYDDIHILRDGNDLQIIVNDVDIGKNYSIDDIELAKALTCSGDFYPFTCGCGCPECADILEPVHCRKEAGGIVWHKKYPAPEETFIFESKKALTELEKVLSEIFDELYDQYFEKTWADINFPHGPLGTSIVTLKQALEFCRNQLKIREQITDHQIRKIILSDLLERDCAPKEFIPALRIGNIHETPGMANEEPIHVAAWHSSYTENIDLLLVRGADINVRDEYEETPLFYAVKGKHPDTMIPHLLWSGADIEAKNDYKQTPFLVALDYLDDPVPVLAILKEHGCNVLATDEQGNGALQYAERRNLPQDVVELLIRWGCQ